MCKVRGVGLDLCEISRMEKDDVRARLLRRCFTEAESAYIVSRGASAAQTMAGVWAAKEAALKALGVGLALPMTDIEVLHTPTGQPCYHMMGKAAELADGGRFHLSITHEGSMAAAVCVWEG